MFETDFNNIDRALRTEEGCASELDYAEQTRELLGERNLHMLFDCPSGAFEGAGMKTVVLSMGHSLDAAGIRMMFDADKQTTGGAGECKVRGANSVGTFNVGGSGITNCAFAVGR